MSRLLWLCRIRHNHNSRGISWFSELTTKMLRRSTHKSEKELIKSINNWIAGWNEDPKPFKWVKTADEIFASMEKYLGPLTNRTSD